MNRIVSITIFAVSMTSLSWAVDKGESISERLIPTGNQSATWESKCTLSMKSTIIINDDNTFDMQVKAYSNAECDQESEYISLSRDGKYQYQAPVYKEYSYDGDDNSNYSYSYSYQASPEQLNLELSPITVDSKGAIGTLAKGLLSMYEGCVGSQKEEAKNFMCKRSGVSKTKSRVRLNKMNFITPTKMIANFRGDVNIEFSLIK